MCKKTLLLSCTCLILGSSLLFSPMASAKTPIYSGQKPATIKGAAQRALEGQRQNPAQTRYMIPNRDGYLMEAKVLKDVNQVQVKSTTPTGKLRTTIFEVGNPASLNPVLSKKSSTLAPAFTLSVRASSVETVIPRNNGKLPAGAPGTLGHTLHVGAQGYHPHAVGLELKANARRDTYKFGEYWLNSYHGKK